MNTSGSDAGTQTSISQSPRTKPRAPVKRSTVDGSSYDRVMLSFRSDRQVIETIKAHARRIDWPYQAVLRSVLKDFADAHPSPTIKSPAGTKTRAPKI